MARIPDKQIERVKRETDLLALVRSRGIELVRHGAKDFAGRCPFHSEDRASFIVTPEAGLFHCMGCGAAGNAIQFVEKFDGVSFRHAYELLAEGKPAFSAPSGTALKCSTVPRLSPLFTPEAGDAELLGLVIDYYHERLLVTEAARDYLKGRGLYHEEAITRFRLGFADRTLGLRLPDKNRKEGQAKRTRLAELGLMRESGHEHFNGSVTMPILTEQNDIGEIYGRKITSGLRKGTPLHLYLPGPHRGIWNLEALNEPEIILCEAPFDALTFWVNGFRNTTFIYGTEGFTDEFFEAILAHHVRRIRLAYDADEAGNRAAARDAERLTSHGIECFRIKFPWGMDANDYARKMAEPAKALQSALVAAVWLDARIKRPSASAGPPPIALSPPAADLSDDAPSSPSSAALLPDPVPTPAPSSLAANNNSLAAKELTSAAKENKPQLERVGEYHLLRLGGRQYRVGGLTKNNSLEVLKVAVRLRHGEDFHLDSFDMAKDAERRRFIERAAEETRLEKELIKRDVGRLLLLLEEEQAARIQAATAASPLPHAPEMTAEEREAALSFLKSPDLVKRIGESFDACGLAGEETNRLAAYLACTSRKLEKSLAILVQSTSAAGKSTLLEAVLAMFPEEERVKYSAMTGQSLYYLGQTDLKFKILAIVEEAGAEKASYALKLLQSEGELIIASTCKDPKTGRLMTQEYRVEGPVMIFLTTTAVEIDEELQNRCLIVTVDESREQTERIHAMQRKSRTLEGLKLKKLRKELLRLMRNIQRLIEPIEIMNPWADLLTFTAERTRTRRDNEKYLTLIDAIALLHQHQRRREKNEDGSDRIRVTLDDIELANSLAPELLGRSLDELAPQTRWLLSQIKTLVCKRMAEDALEQQEVLFSRRELRESLGWSEFQVRVHTCKLEDFEYIFRRWGRQGRGCVYELAVAADTPDRIAHIGLLDVARLRGQEAAGTAMT